MMTLHLSIVTPEGCIFEGSIRSVTLPGSEGEFGVLPGHADTVALLQAGVIEVEKENHSKEMVAVNWGYSKVNEHTVDVLVDGAVAIHASGTENEIANSIDEAKHLIQEASDSDIIIGSVLTKIESFGKSSFS
jgi:F-type H+-transporting ATPase subunit epsilon